MMDLAPFTALLRDVIGLDAASVGVSTIERAVRERLVASRMEALDYLQHLRRSGTEMQELVETVVVPETWFFRDREAFGFLARTAQDEWLRATPDGVVRILSLPCSTGEEPYSIAMALLDAGMPAEQFQIDAVDISARALATAERGIYGRNAFRGADVAFRERYFTDTPAGARLSEVVRRQVRFQRGNLFSPAALPETAIYDAVFCRNLLIYFDRETQDRCVRLLERPLTADGLLFVGPSEAALMLAHSFVSARVALAFAFRKVHRRQDAFRLRRRGAGRRAPTRPQGRRLHPPP
jgi:chemotaxis protein methyltransferase WspC